MTEREIHIALLSAALVPITFETALFAYLAEAFSGEAK